MAALVKPPEPILGLINGILFHCRTWPIAAFDKATKFVEGLILEPWVERAPEVKAEVFADPPPDITTSLPTSSIVINIAI
jgi:hypothetical protein